MNYVTQVHVVDYVTLIPDYVTESDTNSGINLVKRVRHESKYFFLSFSQIKGAVF